MSLKPPLDPTNSVPSFVDTFDSRLDAEESVHFVVDPPSGVAATDAAAIDEQLDAATAAGGGVVELGEGTYLTNAPVSIPANTTLMGRGRGVTIIKAAPSLNDHLVAWTGNNVHLCDLTVDHDRANQTAAHAIRFSGEDHTLRNLIVKNAYAYGIAIAQSAASSAKRCLLDNIYIENTGLDGIDSKDTADANEGNRMNNIVVRGQGITADSSGIDCRGEWHLSNIFVYGVDASDIGLRFRESDSGTTGWGCEGSSLTNFAVYGAAAPDDGDSSYGIQVNSPDVSVSNGYVDNVKIGVVAGGDGVIVTGVTAKGCVASATGRGFWVSSTGTDVQLIGVRALNCRDGALVDGTNCLILGGEFSGSTRHGITPDAAALASMRVVEARFASNSSSDINIGQTASTATMTLPGAFDVIKVSGTADITSITASWNRRRVTLIFTGTAATTGLTDGSNLKLASSLAYTADDAITLVCDGTNWFETGRSVN